MKICTFDSSHASLYTLENENQMKVTLTDIGASIVSIILPDKNKNEVDVNLGYDTADRYFNNGSCYGAVVGRYANRIGNASFELNGKRYELDKNEGNNTLHSGFDKYYRRLWYAEYDENSNSVTFKMISPDLDQGMPGRAQISVKYTLDNDNRLKLEYMAVSDKDTYFNFTNHSYFNLKGHNKGTILDHYLWLDCDRITKIDRESIPTGELIDVKGTPMDFTSEKEIGTDIDDVSFEQIKFAKGYDHNYIINNPSLEKPFAIVRSDDSGIVMEAYTDMPGVQFYTGNNMGKDTGEKDGSKYPPRGGFCLETQFFPDTPNKPEFPSNLFKAKEVFNSTTIYRFTQFLWWCMGSRWCNSKYSKKKEIWLTLNKIT